MKQFFDMLYLIKFEFKFLTLSWPIIAKIIEKGLRESFSNPAH